MIYFPFRGEERGVLGSTAPWVFASRLKPMEFDIKRYQGDDQPRYGSGRLRENRLTVLGGDSATEWPELVNGACEAARIQCTVSGEGYGPSDQTPFFAAGIPVIHFFTGARTGDYHRLASDIAVDSSTSAGAAQPSRADRCQRGRERRCPRAAAHLQERAAAVAARRYAELSILIGHHPRLCRPAAGKRAGHAARGRARRRPRGEGGLEARRHPRPLGAPTRFLRGVEDLMQVLMEQKAGRDAEGRRWSRWQGLEIGS